MLDLVEVGRNLALIDRWPQREGREKRFFQKLYKWWFAMDGVYFNRGHVDSAGVAEEPRHHLVLGGGEPRALHALPPHALPLLRREDGMSRA